MGKLTKMALVLLYLLQLVVVFREQLAHLYKSAVESASSEMRKRDEPETGALRRVFDSLERAAVKIESSGLRERIAAVAVATALPEMVADVRGEGEETHTHEEDKHADRHRKRRHRRISEYLIGNLWRDIRSLWTAVDRPAFANEFARALTYAAS